MITTEINCDILFPHIFESILFIYTLTTHNIITHDGPCYRHLTKVGKERSLLWCSACELHLFCCSVVDCLVKCLSHGLSCSVALFCSLVTCFRYCFEWSIFLLWSSCGSKVSFGLFFTYQLSKHPLHLILTQGHRSHNSIAPPSLVTGPGRL